MPYPSAPATSLGPELPEQELPEQWAEMTSRSELPQTPEKWIGFGKSQKLDIEKLGVIARAVICASFKFESTAEAAGETKPAPGMPWNILEECALQANGVSGVIDCSGAVLEARERIVYRTPTHAVLNAEKATAGEDIAVKTAFDWEVMYEVPICEDMIDLEGVALAQSEETQLSIKLKWAGEDEVFTTLTHPLAKAEGEVTWSVTWFSIGTVKNGHREVIALPDLKSLHGLVERSVPLNGKGKQESPLSRNSGDLLRYYLAAFDGFTSTFDPLLWEQLTIQYGGNQKPLVWEPAKFLVEDNAKHYRERLNVAGVKYAILDTTIDDAMRDAIRPMALSELKAIIGIPSEPAANSKIVSVQETLYPADA